jgi:hypothetical protein
VLTNCMTKWLPPRCDSRPSNVAIVWPLLVSAESLRESSLLSCGRRDGSFDWRTTMVPPWLVREDVPLHILDSPDVVLCRYFSEADMKRLRWTMLNKFRRLMAMCR